jgi:hypothetical protein
MRKKILWGFLFSTMLCGLQAAEPAAERPLPDQRAFEEVGDQDSELHRAARGELEIAEDAIEGFVQRYEGEKNNQNEEGLTPLMLAVFNHDVDFSLKFISVLIDHQVDLNLQAADGRTALHFAILTRSIKKIGLLLRAGARIDISVEGRIQEALGLVSRSRWVRLCFHEEILPLLQGGAMSVIRDEALVIEIASARAGALFTHAKTQALRDAFWQVRTNDDGVTYSCAIEPDAPVNVAGVAAVLFP